jgi:hypothetical protein
MFTFVEEYPNVVFGWQIYVYGWVEVDSLPNVSGIDSTLIMWMSLYTFVDFVCIIWRDGNDGKGAGCIGTS